MVAVAYLRRSRVDTRRPGTLSHDQQLERIRAEAAHHGDNDLVVIEDWGKSGREEREHTRGGFARLEAMVAAGEASAVYAYDLSRLGRSVVTMHRLAKRCAELGIPIRCATGLSPDVSSAEGRMVLTILLAIGEFYAESVQERARGLVMMRRQRGDRIGPAPYGQRVRGGKLEPNPTEDLAAVVAAYEATGSVQAAVRRLNADGVPTRGGKPWQPSTLAQVLEANGNRTRRLSRGRPASHTYLLSGLLRCHCGATLTGVRYHGGRSVGYECKRARTDRAHGRPASVAESSIREWVEGEAARLTTDVEAIADDSGGQDRDELEARRRRVLDNYEDGLITRDERNEKLASVDGQIRALGVAARVEAVPGAIDWSWSTEALNGVLRALWQRVDLGGDLRPTGAVWTVPEWRA